VLYLHEVHQVVGLQQDEFEAAYRDGWMSRMADTDYARLLWYTNHAVGSGVSYNVVTITGIADGRAWEELVTRTQRGDLQSWMLDVDRLRYDVVGKVLVPVHWSPIQEIDLATVPTDGATHDLSLFMEDTGWPSSPIDDYIQSCFQVAHGTHQRREAMLWQRIPDPAGLTHLLTTELPPEHRRPGTYMAEALKFRDQWESKLLRTSSWSPLY
jgi:hypothetical protein